ncbi:MAG: GNAT family protein [Lacisediminihabitans sp.]
MDFSTVPTLTGHLVTLEPLTRDHAAELASAVGELWHIWYTHVQKPEDLPAEVERRLALRETGSMLPFLVRRNDTGEAVGMTTFMNIDAQNRRLEIGSTWLATSAQRTGINTEAKLLLLTHAFDTLDCIAVEFRTHWHNLQSRRAIAELGAKQDGVLRNHQLWRDGTLRDTVVFSIIASEWPTVRLSLREKLRSHSQLR